MAYRLMNTLIKNYENGRTTNSKERLQEMCDVYYAAGRLTDNQYEELTTKISTLEDK